MFEIQIGVHAINSAATFNMNYIRCARVEQPCQRILNYCLATWNQSLQCGGMQASKWNINWFVWDSNSRFSIIHELTTYCCSSTTCYNGLPKPFPDLTPTPRIAACFERKPEPDFFDARWAADTHFDLASEGGELDFAELAAFFLWWEIYFELSIILISKAS